MALSTQERLSGRGFDPCPPLALHLRARPYGRSTPNGAHWFAELQTKWGTKKINKIEQKFKNVEKDNLNYNLVSRTPSAVPGDGLGDARSEGYFFEENTAICLNLANLEQIPSQFHYKMHYTARMAQTVTGHR